MKDPLDSSYRMPMNFNDLQLFGGAFHLASLFESMNIEIAAEIFERCFIS